MTCGPFPGDGVGAVTGDIRDDSVLARAVQPGTDTIFHLAAVTSVVNSIDDPAGTYQTNVAATASLLEFARHDGCGRRSSSPRPTRWSGTSAPRPSPSARRCARSAPYGATKAAAEMLLSCYAGVYGMTTCALRFSNVYGPGMQQKDSFIPRLMRAARDGTGRPGSRGRKHDPRRCTRR